MTLKLVRWNRENRHQKIPYLYIDMNTHISITFPFQCLLLHIYCVHGYFIRKVANVIHTKLSHTKRLAENIIEDHLFKLTACKVLSLVNVISQGLPHVINRRQFIILVSLCSSVQ